jgi:hypothetical protein
MQEIPYNEIFISLSNVESASLPQMKEEKKFASNKQQQQV